MYVGRLENTHEQAAKQITSQLKNQGSKYLKTYTVADESGMSVLSKSAGRTQAWGASSRTGLFSDLESEV